MFQIGSNRLGSNLRGTNASIGVARLFTGTAPDEFLNDSVTMLPVRFRELTSVVNGLFLPHSACIKQ